MPVTVAPDNIDRVPHRPVPERWRRRETDARAISTVRPVGARPGAGRCGTIHLDGRRWIVALDHHRARVADLVGMRYLAELLTRPGQVIPALTLASRGAVQRSSSRHEVLDDEARAAYHARARELMSDLAEAEADNDLVRAERFRLELDALVGELESATGLGGRSRAFTDPAERARSSVGKAIRRAIEVVDDASPAIADALRATVQCGTVCSYVPDPEAPIRWSTQPPPPETIDAGGAGGAGGADGAGGAGGAGDTDRRGAPHHVCCCAGGSSVVHIVISIGVTKGLW
jgi:hypothetical protein